MHENETVFDVDSHARFAELSGDHNPVHMDPIAARRTQVGTPIVHGIHSLLQLIEHVVQRCDNQRKILSLKAQFRNPIFVGERGRVEVAKVAPETIRARLLIGPVEAVVASIGFEPGSRAAPFFLRETTPDRLVEPTSPAELTLQDMQEQAGYLDFGRTADKMAAVFPSATTYLGAHQVAALACCSRLVGMVIPGLHSFFVGLQVFFGYDKAIAPEELHFKVLAVEPRFRLVRIDVQSGGMQGSLEAVSRLPPARQSGMARLTALVGKDEFRSCTALIVGGSRGLGEVTAKLIAAGGGRVVVTYAAGHTDAATVADEIRQIGAQCDTLHYDIRVNASEQLANIRALAPGHLYYFPTPPIFRRKTGLFDPTRFAEFNAFYVAGFFDLVQECLRLRPDGIKVFYPSSEAVTLRPAGMTEYAMSKAAAEILCTDMQEYLPGVRVITRRLPRLPTDQTSTVLQVESADPVEVLLAIVREMQ